MQIDQVNNYILKEYKNQKDKADHSADPVTPKSNDSVTLDISNQGKTKSDQIQTMRLTMTYLRDMNSVRQDKVEEIQRKINEGFYDSASDVHRIVAERLMSLLSD
ncbi:MAG: flagellar biosynthesis anti-sigma factor FlgM [Candidatus Delongbacteria bacterium]|nr:flagellar biosynthesis anti-sigma factor FlgM [Candidatus Delongbacteria bacterium]